MTRRVKSSTLSTLFIWTCLCCSSQVTSARNNSEVSSVFWRAIGTTTLGELLGGTATSGTLNGRCLDLNDSYGSLKSCLQHQHCISGDEVAQLYGLSLDAGLDERTLNEVAPAVLYASNQRLSCTIAAAGNDTHSQRPSPAAVWGYSFLFVTLINLCSLTGILVLPCMKSRLYKIILMFMVALAVGTLVGSGVLVLIPEAFELAHVGGGGAEGKESSHAYIWTCTSIIGGIYLFFLIERFMRMINVWRENTKEKKKQDEMATRGTVTSSFTRKTPQNVSLKLKDPANLHLQQSPSTHCLCSINVSREETSPERSCNDSSEAAAANDEDDAIVKTGNECDAGDILILDKKQAVNGDSHHSHHHHHNGQVAPVAYMVIFGDGLHNFIDGLSIGAAFTDNIMLGISVSVAVMCEELPHELGDFAILLNAGMRLRKALMYNFLSSLMCYCGLVIGILVGENTTAHTWIFGVAGGMFLYISLVDMMPELNSAADSQDGKRFGMVRTFLLQNLGLITGYTVILFMARYGGAITFE